MAKYAAGELTPASSALTVVAPEAVGLEAADGVAVSLVASVAGDVVAAAVAGADWPVVVLLAGAAFGVEVLLPHAARLPADAATVMISTKRARAVVTGQVVRLLGARHRSAERRTRRAAPGPLPV